MITVLIGFGIIGCDFCHLYPTALTLTFAIVKSESHTLIRPKSPFSGSQVQASSSGITGAHQVKVTKTGCLVQPFGREESTIVLTVVDEESVTNFCPTMK